MKCQLCNKKLIKIFSLGKIPLCNNFNLINSKKKVRKYPLDLYQCKYDKLVQLGRNYRREKIFGNQYDYLTGSSESLKKYFKLTANELIKKFNLKKGDTVIEIGCNDGTFLNYFKKKKINILGIDGSKNAYKSSKIKEYIIKTFFEKGISRVILKKVKKESIKLILAFNVLAHSNNLRGMMDEIKKLMSINTILVTQNHSLHNLIKNSEFDTIYHEHLRYFSSYSFFKLLKKFNINLFHIREKFFYGKSLLFFSSLKKNKLDNKSLQLLNRDKKIKVVKSFSDLKEKLQVKKRLILNLLNKIKKKKLKVVGIGAPIKSTIFLNYFQINSKLINHTLEVNKYRINKKIPGVEIPIFIENIKNIKADYLIILSWNMHNQIVDKIKNKGYVNKFIKLYPNIKIHR